MRSSLPPRAWVMACNLGTSSSILISVFCRNTPPLVSTDTVSGSLSWSSDFACVCGRSIGTPTVKSGADTMKMISSTSITSTIGVTLISDITGLRRWRRLPTAIPALAPPAPIVPSGRFVDLPRQDRGKLVGKPLKPLRLLVHLGDELVIENRRRDGGNKADRGREQGLGDAGRHNRQGCVLRGRNRLEAGHDAPDGAEQADEGTSRADRREHQQTPL